MRIKMFKVRVVREFNDSHEAMICTFEYTYCEDCVTNVLHNVCPNCGGGFEKNPQDQRNV
jgi:hypothetical protein